MEVAHIFRSYDIRGIVGQDLNENIMEKIGHAFGQYINRDAVIAYDARVHSPALNEAFLKGFLLSGKSIEQIGLSTLGAGMFHAWQANKEFAYITASHLTKEWNGVKFFHGNGIGFLENETKKIRDLYFSELPQSRGILFKKDTALVLDTYIKYLLEKIKINRDIRVVLDPGNGCASLIVPSLFRQAGCQVKTIFENIDGTFPSRLPDPLDRELGRLKKEVLGYDLGIAYDGDADRMAIIDDAGGFLLPEESSYIVLSELLKKEKGPVIANVECTRAIDIISGKFGRQVIRVPVGHTFLMDAVYKNGASYGVESAGHYVIPSVAPFDDAVITSLYVAHVLSLTEQKLSDMRKQIPKFYVERFSYKCPDSEKFDIIKNLISRLAKDFENANTMDGIRIDMDNGWALLRVSNTAPVIRLTIEGSTETDKRSIQKTFVSYIEDEYKERGLVLEPEH